MSDNTPSNKSYAYLTLFLVTLFYIYTLALQIIPNLLINKWPLGMHPDAASKNFLYASFFYTYAPAQLMAGLLYDRFNAKYILIIGMLVCAVSASLWGMAESFSFALISHLLLGLGAAFATIGTLVVISRLFASNRFALLASFIQAIYALSTFLSFHNTRIDIDISNWKLFFLLLSLVGFILAMCSMLLIKNNTPHPRTPRIKEHFKVVLGNGENWVAILYSFAIWMPLTIFGGMWGIPYLQVRYQLSYETALSMVSIIWLGLAFSTPLISGVADLFRRQQTMMVLCAITGLGTILTILYYPTTTLTSMGILLVLLGIAAAGQNLTFARMNEVNEKTLRGTAFGLNNLALLIGGVLFQPLIGILLDWHWGGQFQQTLTLYSPLIYQRALLILIPCYGIALFVSALLLQNDSTET